MPACHACLGAFKDAKSRAPGRLMQHIPGGQRCTACHVCRIDDALHAALMMLASLMAQETTTGAAPHLSCGPGFKPVAVRLLRHRCETLEARLHHHQSSNQDAVQELEARLQQAEAKVCACTCLYTMEPYVFVFVGPCCT